MKTNSVVFWRFVESGAWVGVFVATLLHMILVVLPMKEVISKMDKLVKECESNIPRNMHCELRADIKESE